MQLSAYMLQSQNSKTGRQETSIWLGQKPLRIVGVGCSVWTPSGRVMRVADIQPLIWIEKRHGNFHLACPPSCPTVDTWGKSNAYLSRYSTIKWNTITEEWNCAPWFGLRPKHTWSRRRNRRQWKCDWIQSSKPTGFFDGKLVNIIASICITFLW